MIGRPIEQLIALASQLTASGEIGDGMVAQFHQLAEASRDDYVELQAVGLNEARKRLATEVALNRLTKAASVGTCDLWPAIREAEQVLDRTDDDPPPLPMIMHCPTCGTQHIDGPDALNIWTNPPHRSHQCQHCGCVWRPCDFPTTGVATVTTMGKADTWAPCSGGGTHVISGVHSPNAQEEFERAITAGHAETIADAGQ